MSTVAGATSFHSVPMSICVFLNVVHVSVTCTKRAPRL